MNKKDSKSIWRQGEKGIEGFTCLQMLEQRRGFSQVRKIPEDWIYAPRVEEQKMQNVASLPGCALHGCVCTHVCGHVCACLRKKLISMLLNSEGQTECWKKWRFIVLFCYLMHCKLWLKTPIAYLHLRTCSGAEGHLNYTGFCRVLSLLSIILLEAIC